MRFVLRNFTQKQIGNANPRRNLTTEENKRLAKLEAVANKLRRGENVQNRQLQTWLSEDEYEQIAAEWDTQNSRPGKSPGFIYLLSKGGSDLQIASDKFFTFCDFFLSVIFPFIINLKRKTNNYENIR